MLLILYTSSEAIIVELWNRLMLLILYTSSEAIIVELFDVNSIHQVKQSLWNCLMLILYTSSEAIIVELFDVVNTLYIK